VPADYEQLYQQAFVEMQQPDFVARWHLLTIWGKNTPREKPDMIDHDPSLEKRLEKPGWHLQPLQKSVLQFCNSSPT
jgi:hypothetical protein